MVDVAAELAGSNDRRKNTRNVLKCYILYFIVLRVFSIFTVCLRFCYDLVL